MDLDQNPFFAGDDEPWGCDSEGEDPKGEDPGMGEDPEFGDDILSIRMKAMNLLKSRGVAVAGPSAGGPEAAPGQATHNPGSIAERKAKQVDLNQKELVAQLEDPDLVAHMCQRRMQAAEASRLAAQRPDFNQLRQDDAKARRALSSLTVALKERQMEFRCSCEEVVLAAENAGRIAAGETPHGYPAPPKANLADQCRHLSQKLRRTGAGLEAAITALEQLEADLVLARRGHDAASTGLLLLADPNPPAAGED